MAQDRDQWWTIANMVMNRGKHIWVSIDEQSVKVEGRLKMLLLGF
jgi:hypothetical protein